MQLVVELPAREEQMELNRRRWAELLADPALADLPFRIETNAHGQILMTPPASGEHSDRQSKIILALHRLLGGHPLPECPISTIDGVKAADVGWYSESRFDTVRGQDAFEHAPEICVEVISSSNTDSEMRQKKKLYFEAGADEVWFCRMDGQMEFYQSSKPNSPNTTSARCSNFPSSI
ncbi:MAG TPA: Uma2 family endonuclease [Pirellulaceae bacterium]|nr:Uma2 family endonuclease [Pirellulaceae bacterium]